MTNTVERIREKLDKKLHGFIAQAAPGEGHLIRIGFNGKERTNLRERWQRAVGLIVTQGETAVGKIAVGCGTAVFLDRAGIFLNRISSNFEIPSDRLLENPSMPTFLWNTFDQYYLATPQSAACVGLAHICWNMAPWAVAAGIAWAAPSAWRAVGGVLSWMQVNREQKYKEQESLARAGKSVLNMMVLPLSSETAPTPQQIEPPSK